MNPRFASSTVLASLAALTLGCGALALLASSASGCATSSSTSGFTEGDDAGTPDPGTDGGGGGGGGGGPGFGEGGVQEAAAGDLPAIVWGHSDTTLYKLDPNTKAVTVVGDFKGCTKVTDLAVDKKGVMFVTTQDGLYSVNADTVTCTLIKKDTYPNSLSFVPEGTVDANDETLVGYVDDVYVRIDRATGVITNIGTLKGPSGVVSSGDIVSVKGGTTYLTVKGGTACTKSDCLVEVDPTTGKMVHDWGTIGFSKVFGLAFWAGTVYGFDNSGDLFEVTFSGTKTMTSKLSIPNAPSGLVFWGAGSSTAAPVGPK